MNKPKNQETRRDFLVPKFNSVPKPMAFVLSMFFLNSFAVQAQAVYDRSSLSTLEKSIDSTFLSRYDLLLMQDTVPNIKTFLYPYEKFESPEQAEMILSNLRQSLAMVLSKYPDELIKSLNLSSINLLYSIKYGRVFGVHRIDENDISLAYDSPSFVRTAYHELLHAIQLKYPINFSDWKNINNVEMKYIGSKCVELSSASDGFVSDYAQSSVEEDIAETLSYMFHPDFFIQQALKNEKKDNLLLDTKGLQDMYNEAVSRFQDDEVIQKKINFLKKHLSIISHGQINNQYWADLENGKVGETYWLDR